MNSWAMGMILKLNYLFIGAHHNIQQESEAVVKKSLETEFFLIQWSQSRRQFFLKISVTGKLFHLAL